MPRASQQILDFYARPGRMTAAGRHAPLLAALPRERKPLAETVQGLLLHEHFAPSYGVELSPERRTESHIRPASEMLDRILARDGRPLSVPRRLEDRLIGVCRDFTVLAVAILRAQGVPARARCGFGSYFVPGQLEDHWVCELWDASRDRWVLVDTQLDDHQRRALGTDFDVLDVPRDRFLVASDAWTACRGGQADPSRFGIFTLRGLWFVAGNLLRDFAALSAMEMLPWDCWGAMPSASDQPTSDQLSLLDRVAAVARSPDDRFAEMRMLYESDDRLRVPGTVLNALRNRVESV